MTTAQMVPDIGTFRAQYERGFSLIPLLGKTPVEEGWTHYCSTDRGFIEDDFKDHNAGVCCGPASGVLVLDIDDPETFELLAETNGWEMPNTYTVRTGGGGLHHYYRYPDDQNDYGNKSLKHPAWSGHTIFDVRGNGGYVVAAGSVHPDTDRVYTVEKDADIAESPEWLKRYVLGGDVNREALWDISIPDAKARKFVETLKVSGHIVQLILEGKPSGERSEAIRSVLLSLLKKDVPDRKIEFIFEQYQIGEKFREKGAGRSKWLEGEIRRAKEQLRTGESQAAPQAPQVSSEEPYPHIITELNDKHAVVMLGGKTVIMKEIIEPTFQRPDLQFLSITDFNNWYSNRQVNDPGTSRQVPISKYWLKSPQRRQYEGIVFNPQGDEPGYYNLWQGFGIEPKPGDWSLMQSHIRDVIADGNPDVYQYIINWMADLVQNPGGKRPGVSIVLRGDQGTGKGCFVTNLGQMMGNHFLHITNQRQLTGRFNQHLKDALLVFVDEGIWAGSKESEGILKAMITEDRLMIEPKGKDIFHVKNHLRLIFASNNQWVVPAGMQDRRFMVLDVSNAHARDRSWFDPLWRQMGNGGREAMLHDLLEVDLSGVDLRDFPRTEARLDQIVSTMSPIDKFWLDRLHEGDSGSYRRWSDPIDTDDLYEKYTESARSLGDRFLMSKHQFGRKLRELCPDVERVRQTTGSREWAYQFPSLDECRKAFEKKVGQPIAWD